jgi:23S rRNA (cytosine1962-C5)-methyltransferase
MNRPVKQQPRPDRRAPPRAARPVAAYAGRPPRVVLREGREKSLERRHPWIFAGSSGRVDGEPAAGDAVAVVDARGAFAAWALYSPASQIRARVWSWRETEPVDAARVDALVRASIARREGFGGNAMRLVHGEADGLPGVVIDRYADLLVVQITSAGAERWRDVIVDAAADATGCARVCERSDVDVREIEGLAPRAGMLRGDDAEVEIVEDGLRYAIDALHGQKTGFYLDQRDNRAVVRRHAKGLRVLNCFCYTGGFSLAAASGGAASVLSIDSSAPALELAARNAALNGLHAERLEWREADVFAALRDLRNAAASFDLVVLDPPKFAPTAGHAERAARAYKDINLLGLKLLAPGGLLATFSCSGGVDADLFQKIVAGAAADAGADVAIRQRFMAAADHPVSLAFPEGEYLKGLLLHKR